MLMMAKVTVWEAKSQFWILASGIALVMGIALISGLVWAPPELMIGARLRGFEVVAPPQNFLEGALQYESADAAADARQAVARGDRRLWAVNERGSLIPGVEPGLSDWYIRNFKIRTMYLSDVIEGPAQERFETAFDAYIERYNATVLAVSDR